MFTPREKEYIIEQLTNRLTLEDRPRRTITGPFQWTTFPNDLEGDNAPAMARSAMDLCIRDGWNHNPMWMELMLDIYQLREEDKTIKDIWESAKIKPPDPPDPLEQMVFNNNTPFVNRTGLRAKIKTLESNAGNIQPILIVNGTEQSGKSYSSVFIDHFSNIKSSIWVYRIHIDENNEMDMGAEQIAADLVHMMGRTLKDKPQPTTNAKRYISELAMWVLNEAVQVTGRQQWFILDNFNSVNLPPDAKDLLIALSSSVTNGIFSSRCRVVILGFDSSQLSVDVGKIREDDVLPCTEADIDTAIAEVLTHVEQAPQNLKDLIKGYVKNGLPKDKTKMKMLNCRLSTLLYAIVRVKSILEGHALINFNEILLHILDGLPADESGMAILKKERLPRLQESINEL